MATYERSAGRGEWSARIWPVLLLAALGGVLLWRFWPSLLHRSNPGLDPSAAPRPVAARGDLAADEQTTVDIFRQVSPSVVHITTLTVRHDALSLDLFQIPKGTGSGFIWDEGGRVVTNYHVIQTGNAARVTLADQSGWTARLVGAYPDKDLAVLVIDAPRGRIRPILVGSSHDLLVGQKAYAIGNPFGLDQTLTTGVISAVGREIESVTRHTIKDAIQTDAAINPGNSGGPLLDSAGRLIGVNTAIYSPSGAFSGIGFAIPVDEVNRVVPQIIRHGKVTRAGLGVRLAPDQVTRRLGVNGALVLEVLPDSPAARAGLQPTRRDENNQIELGDVIAAVDDKPVRSAKELLDLLERHGAGDTVTLTVRRDGRERRVPVTLETIPQGAQA